MKTIIPITPHQHIQEHHALTDNSLQFLDNIINHKQSFPFVNDNVVELPKIEPSQYRRHDLHTADTIVSEDNQVTFRTYKFLPKSFYYHGILYETYDPQGIIVTPGGENAYICINASSSDSDNIKFKDNRDGQFDIQFIRVNLKELNPITSIDEYDFMAGPPMNLGHGQSSTMNTNGDIITLDKEDGTSSKAGICKIDKSTLTPSNYGEIQFRAGYSQKHGYRFGDDFCALSNGNYLNICPNVHGNSPLVPQNALKLYEISFDYNNGVHAHVKKQYIANAGGVTIQGITENPHSQRITVLYDNGMISFPEAKMGHLRPEDFKQVTFNDMRESEGLAYDDNGNAYFLTDRSPEIMISQDLKDF